MKKALSLSLVLLLSLLLLAGCGGAASSSAPASDAPAPASAPPASSVAPATSTAEPDPVTLLVAAAASLEYAYSEQLIPLFQEQHPWITVEGSYDSSGKLQTQIEEGLEADLFMSAANTQMNALVEQDLVDADSVVQLLENEIVLIAPADSDTEIASFEGMVNADSVALGDPESVPAGQYAQEALTHLGVYDQVAANASFGANVTEVLNWVAEGSAELGIVYATDAATTDAVRVLATAPEGSLESKVIYPVGIVSASANKEAAQLFIDFLQSPEAIDVFIGYGFKSNL